MPALVPADGGHVALLRAGQGPLVLQVRRVVGRGVHDILEVSLSFVSASVPEMLQKLHTIIEIFR